MPDTFLAFDIGLSRTGVAKGSSFNNSASPVTSLQVSKGRHNWAEVDKLIKEWQPAKIVIGDTSKNDPALLKASNRFRAHIESQHKLPVIAVSEHLSTVSANAEIADKELSLGKRKNLRDQIAACLILETYLNSQNG